MLGLIYMDRFIQRNDFALTALNVHRVAITSVMVAAKFFDDQYYNNAYYAKVRVMPSWTHSCSTRACEGVKMQRQQNIANTVTLSPHPYANLLSRHESPAGGLAP